MNVVTLHCKEVASGGRCTVYFLRLGQNSDEWKNFLDFIGIRGAKSAILSE